ncbi:MAG: protein kinase [Chlamydiia bacterium]|nr:protein kinase [Chlamydiia bacterium]
MRSERPDPSQIPPHSDGSGQHNTRLTETYEDLSMIRDHIPAGGRVHFVLDNYEVIEKIAHGGMGEVFLAYDRICGRRIALKRIRTDLAENPRIRRRFLHEARLTSQLTHPSIIPIFSLHAEGESPYYTMPYVDGRTLKGILRTTRRQLHRGEALDPIGGSIPALIRIFTMLCQGVSYAHSKGVLHRDLKPENVMIGRFGEVLILDWGLAKLYGKGLEEEVDLKKTIDRSSVKGDESHPEMTLEGKVVGTLNYLAPERAGGHESTVQSEIYSLGVILYQLLSLQMPFKRKSLEHFRKTLENEQWLDPQEMAPHRDIPLPLARIVHKCLSKEIYQRYDSVDALIEDLNIYIEGRPGWYSVTELDVRRRDDWQFQEHVFLPDYIEIARSSQQTDWVNLMLSHASVPEPLRLETTLRIEDPGKGVGFLLCIPEEGDRHFLHDGYCVWLARSGSGATRVLRGGVEVYKTDAATLVSNTWVTVRIEKVEDHLSLYLNDVLQYTYFSHLPIVGTHVGVISRDAHFEMGTITLSTRSPNTTVSCLAIPDTLLAYRDYERALSQYLRIAHSFPGLTEGRDALFRAGVTLIERGEENDGEEALELFSRLQSTSGAPLEYLGKALYYERIGECEEEVKCFEMALRRYSTHPMIQLIREKIAQRMYESSQRHRKLAYRFALMIVHHRLNVYLTSDVSSLFQSMRRNWEVLPFLLSPHLGREEKNRELDQRSEERYFSQQLAFWCAEPHILEEILTGAMRETKPDSIIVGNTLMALVILGFWPHAKALIDDLHANYLTRPIERELELAEMATLPFQGRLEEATEKLLSYKLSPSMKRRYRSVYILTIEEALAAGRVKMAQRLLEGFEEKTHLKVDDVYWIWLDLLEGNWRRAGGRLHRYPPQTLTDETHSLFFLYGCWLEASEGHEIAQMHFLGLLDMPYPRIPSLLGHFLLGNLSNHKDWFKKAFLYEKRQLYRQLSLYARCSGDREMAQHYRQLELGMFSDE